MIKVTLPNPADPAPELGATCPEAPRARISAAAAACESRSRGLQQQRRAGKGRATSAQTETRVPLKGGTLTEAEHFSPTNHHFCKVPDGPEAAAGPEPGRNQSDTSSGFILAHFCLKVARKARLCPLYQLFSLPHRTCADVKDPRREIRATFPNSGRRSLTCGSTLSARPLLSEKRRDLRGDFSCSPFELNNTGE